MKKWIITLILSLVLCVCQAASADALTPQEAVSQMTWGVNLCDLYMTGNYYQEAVNWDSSAVSTLGYCKFAPMGVGVWFWDGSFDWMAYTRLHEDSFEISAPVPYYYSQGNDGVTNGHMFEIGLFLNKYAALTATVELQDTRIVLQNGTIIPLGLDGIYTADNFSFYNDLASCTLNISGRLPVDQGSQYNGATIRATVIQKDVPFSETGKVDFFFEYPAVPGADIDQYEYTDTYLDQGVNVFRLPVTWTAFVNDETFEIDRAWLDAVRTEVDYILSKGAYCILNVHEDYLQDSFVGDHWEKNWNTSQYADYVNARFKAIWRQISEYFEDCSDHLIFESANEPLASGINTNDPAQADLTNNINQMFVETVRETGGNNAERILCLAAPAYCRPERLDELELPEDDYLIVTTHSYMELENSIKGQGAGYEGYDYESKTDEYFSRLQAFTQQTGIPVLIGEVGATHMLSEETRAQRAAYYYQKAKEAGVIALWWEDQYTDQDGFHFWIYDVANRTWGDALVLDEILDALELEIGPSLEPPTMQLTADTYEAGEDVVALITGQDPETELIAAYVVAADNRTRIGDYQATTENGQTVIRVPAEDLTVGQYRMRVIGLAGGHKPGYASAEFTVREAVPDFAFETDADEVTTCQNVKINFSAKGAARLEVQITRIGDEYWEGDYYDVDADTGEWYWSNSRSGEYLFVPVAWYDRYDDQGNLVRESRSDPEATLTVAVAAQTWPDPLSLDELPLVMQTGTAISLEVNMPEQAQWGFAQLTYCEGSEWDNMVNRNLNAADEDFSILSFDSSLLNREGRYRIWVSASGYGMEEVFGERYFQVQDTIQDGDISLTIEDSTTVEDWPSYREFRIQVHAPGAAAVRVMNEWGTWDTWDSSTLNENEDGVYTFTKEAGTYRTVAQASYDGYTWTVTSNEARITVTDQERPEPVIRIPEYALSNTDLPFMIEDAVIPDGSYWQVALFECNGDAEPLETVKWSSDTEESFPQHFTIPGDKLQPDLDYYIDLYIMDGDIWVIQRFQVPAGAALVLPTGLTEIGPEAFDQVQQARILVIPESVRTIDPTAYANTGIRTVYGKNDTAQDFANDQMLYYIPLP